MIHHFRYLSRYIDEGLRKRLPRRLGRLPKELDRLPVVVVYMFQEQARGAWRLPRDAAKAYTPLRCGTLIEAFWDGDVAHFYFMVTDYVRANVNRKPVQDAMNTVTFKTKPGKDAPRSYAHLGPDLKLGASAHGDARAFQDIVEYAARATEWRTRSLGSAPLDVTYDVVFFRVAGVFHERAARLSQISPALRLLAGNPLGEYTFVAGETHYLRINTHLLSRLPSQLPGEGAARLSLRFDPRIFRSVGPTSFRISSSYDLEYWAILPHSTIEERTVLTVSCEHDSPTDRTSFVRRELLCPEVSLPVVIRPSRSSP